MKPFFNSKLQEIIFLSITMLAFIVFYVETDIYTPSFPDMLTYFQTNEDNIQKILSVNFFGLCLSGLFYGPFSDSFGRKKVLSVGLLIFMLGSIGCSFSEMFGSMVFFRFLQGIGCGAIISVGAATIFDVYPPEKSSSLISFLNGTVGGMMALAPIIGNWISIHMGWRMNFYLIAFLGAITYLTHLFFTHETLPAEKRSALSLSNVLRNYASLLTNFPFMAHTFIWCLGFSMVIVYIANLSLIFIDYLHVDKAQFGYYQAAIMSAFFLGSMGGAYIIKKWGTLFTKKLGSFLYLGGVLLLSGLCCFRNNDPLLVIASMAIISLGSAIACTIYFSYSMSFIEENLKGSAMSLAQSLRLALSSGLVAVGAFLFDGTILPLALLSLACTSLCIVLYSRLYAKKLHLIQA